MRLVFAGTPVFAAVALRALVEAGHEIAAVLCQPDRPAGRGQKLVAGPVKTLALALGLPVWQPASLRDPEVQQALANLDVDLWVVAAYGLLLPAEILAQPPHGCLNIHGSLLPRWRGAAPIQRALLAGDAQTGIGIMQMEVGLDTGAVLLEATLPITAQDTAATLHDALADLGARLAVTVLADLPRHQAAARPQPAEGVTYAAKLRKEEALLDFQQSAVELHRAIRAFDPVPGARFLWNGQPIRVAMPALDPADSARALAQNARPGTVLQVGASVAIATANGVLHVQRLQRPGGKWLSAREFLQAVPLQPGDMLA